jgi:hypothetical protein
MFGIFSQNKERRLKKFQNSKTEVIHINSDNEWEADEISCDYDEESGYTTSNDNNSYKKKNIISKLNQIFEIETEFYEVEKHYFDKIFKFCTVKVDPNNYPILEQDKFQKLIR